MDTRQKKHATRAFPDTANVNILDKPQPVGVILMRLGCWGFVFSSSIEAVKMDMVNNLGHLTTAQLQRELPINETAHLVED